MIQKYQSQIFDKLQFYYGQIALISKLWITKLVLDQLKLKLDLVLLLDIN